MQMGFNNDVEHLGVTLHIQTEDHGMAARKVTSQLFVAGVILEARTLAYAPVIEAAATLAEQEELVRRQMRTMHKAFHKRILEGAYDSKLGRAEHDAASTEEPSRDAAVDAVADPVVDAVAKPAEAARPVLLGETTAYRGFDGVEDAQALLTDLVAGLAARATKTDGSE